MQKNPSSQIEYIPLIGTRVAVLTFLIVGPLLLAAIFTSRIFSSHGTHSSKSEVIVLIVLTFISLTIIWLGLSWISTKVLIGNNFLVIRTFFKRERILMSDIQSTKVFYTKNGPLLFVYYNNKKTAIPYIFSKDTILDIAAKIDAPAS